MLNQSKLWSFTLSECEIWHGTVVVDRKFEHQLLLIDDWKIRWWFIFFLLLRNVFLDIWRWDWWWISNYLPSFSIISLFATELNHQIKRLSNMVKKEKWIPIYIKQHKNIMINSSSCLSKSWRKFIYSLSSVETWISIEQDCASFVEVKHRSIRMVSDNCVPFSRIILICAIQYNIQYVHWCYCLHIDFLPQSILFTNLLPPVSFIRNGNERENIIKKTITKQMSCAVKMVLSELLFHHSVLQWRWQLASIRNSNSIESYATSVCYERLSIDE